MCHLKIDPLARSKLIVVATSLYTPIKFDLVTDWIKCLQVLPVKPCARTR